MRQVATSGGARGQTILGVKVGGQSIADVLTCPWLTLAFVRSLQLSTHESQRLANGSSSGARLQFLLDVGLDYLTLSRSADTSPAVRRQRIRLATQIGSGPGRRALRAQQALHRPACSINRRLIETLTKLHDMGNTLIVVEHDRHHARSRLDVDVGPGAGEHGGEIVHSLAAARAALKEHQSPYRRRQVPHPAASWTRSAS